MLSGGYSRDVNNFFGNENKLQKLRQSDKEIVRHKQIATSYNHLAIEKQYLFLLQNQNHFKLYRKVLYIITNMFTEKHML